MVWREGFWKEGLALVLEAHQSGAAFTLMLPDEEKLCFLWLDWVLGSKWFKLLLQHISVAISRMKFSRVWTESQLSSGLLPYTVVRHSELVWAWGFVSCFVHVKRPCWQWHLVERSTNVLMHAREQFEFLRVIERPPDVLQYYAHFCLLSSFVYRRAILVCTMQLNRDISTLYSFCSRWEQTSTLRMRWVLGFGASSSSYDH